MQDTGSGYVWSMQDTGVWASEVYTGLRSLNGSSLHRDSGFTGQVRESHSPSSWFTVCPSAGSENTEQLWSCRFLFLVL